MRPGQSGGRHCARHRRDRWQAGYRHLTLVYQLNAGRRLLLWAGEERRIEALESFFTWFGTDRAAALRVVCSDTWKAYLSRDPQSRRTGMHVRDRFHVAGKLGEMIDTVHAAEARELKMQGELPVLKRPRT